LYSTAHSQLKFIFATLFTVLIISSACANLIKEDHPLQMRINGDVPENMFTVPGQIVLDDDVKSIQLFRTGSVRSAPIIRLGSGENLTLRFDMIGFESRGFYLTFTHHDPNWNISAIHPEYYLDGHARIYFGGGTVSRSQRPYFRIFEYRFPNRDVSFKTSGNYMVRVHDEDTGNMLFSIPFFIHENEGDIISSTQVIYAPRQGLRVMHIPQSRYLYPDKITMPGFDLQYSFIQNRFWGRSVKADIYDISTEGEVHYEVSRNRGFIGDYEFLLLEMGNLTQLGNRITAYKPEAIPPTVLLRDDVAGLSPFNDLLSVNRFGVPKSGPEALYGKVQFTLDAKQQAGSSNEIYLVGDFNNWMIQPDHKLRYNDQLKRWTGNAIIKEGVYSYKYVVLDNNVIKDLSLDNSFTRNKQEYTTFVYYRDPQRFYYRILQSNTFYSN